MTVASIDIGTNTVLLLIARIDEKGNITPIAYEQRVPRLGRGVDGARNLSHDSMLRVTAVLSEYRTIIENNRPDKTVVAGTSAVRDAHNKAEFAALVKRETGPSGGKN